MIDNAYILANPHKSGHEIARDLGADPGNVCARIRRLRAKYPELDWREDPRHKQPFRKRRYSVPTIVPARIRRADLHVSVLAGDMHGHLVDKAAFGCLLGYLTENDIDEFQLMGDGVEFKAVSPHRKTPRQRADFGYEVAFARDGIRKPIDEALAGRKRPVVKKWGHGNHEDMLRRFLLDHAPELYALYELDELSVRSVLKLPESGWEYIDPVEFDCYSRVGIVTVGHFNKYRKQPGKAALELMEERGENVLQFHTHKIGGGLKRFPDGRVLMGYEVGCLRNLSPGFCTDPTWAHGFGILKTVRHSSRFFYTQVNIVGGEALIDGVRYTP